MNSKIAISLVALATASALAWGLYPRGAEAQTHPPTETTTPWSTGPLELKDGQTARIGVVFPVVDDITRNSVLMIFDSEGVLIYSGESGGINESHGGGHGAGKVSMHDISFSRPGGPTSLGVMQIRKFPSGEILATIPNSDGVFIGLLLPAIQKIRVPIYPSAASMQVFDSEDNGGGTVVFTGLERN